MAFIVKRKNREGKHYVYLLESYREKDKVKQRTLASYGSLEELERNEPGAFERLRREAKDGTIGGRELEKLVVTYDLNAEIQADDLAYGWKVFDDLYKHLRIPKALIPTQKSTRSKSDLNEILRLLVFQRILDPGSKLFTLDSQKGLFGDWNVDENGLYRSLKHINSAKEGIQMAVHKAISETIGRSAALVFYDVTNYYFETDVDDEDVVDENGETITEGIRRRGASKERRPKPIVQLGLFMDSNGIPISYKLFRGNQTDPITYLPAIEQVKRQFGIERVVVVADKAMNSKNNISETLENGDGWLFSQKHRGRRGAPKNIQEFLLDASGWEYNEELTFAKKSTVRTRLLNKGGKVQEKVLATWSKKYADREKIRRDGALEYASKLTNAEVFRQTCKKGGKKYLELFTVDQETGEKVAFSPFIKVDSDEVAFDEKFDGMNVLVTSELSMSDEDMLVHYRELSKIEDCFRVTKTEFSTRPVFVWKREHIEAHFLTCFLALVMIRIVQNKTKWSLSPERLVRALNSARANLLGNGFYRVQASDDLKEINRLLGIQWERGIVKSEDLSNYAKGWCTTG